MAEGRRDRSGRRRRKSEREQPRSRYEDHQYYHQQQQSGYYQQRAVSDSEVAQAGRGILGAREKCHFHEGVDVDQLARYRRRRIEAPRPKEKDHQQRRHLQLPRKPGPIAEDEAEKLGKLVTEYRLAFRAASHDDIYCASQDTSLRLKNQDDGNLSDSRASYSVPLEKPKIVDQINNKVDDDEADGKGVVDADLDDNDKNEKDDEDDDKKNKIAQKSQTTLDFEKILEMGTEIFKRQAPIRRPTTLRYEGDFSSATEYSTIFVAHSDARRPELRRRGTSLRLEGDFDARTEKNEQFLDWSAMDMQRPEPFRLSTNLKMEGELETKTEVREQYVPFVGARRPEILKRSAQLRNQQVQTDSRWTPEYADVFREFGFVERPVPKLPLPNLRPDGGFYDQTEVKTFFGDPREKKAELLKNGHDDEEGKKTNGKKVEDEDEEEEDENDRKKQKQHEERARLKKKEEMRMLVSRLEDLQNPPLEIPEYKAAYKDYPRERAKIAKPEGEIGLSDGSKLPSSSAKRFNVKIDQDPEYKSMYIPEQHRSKEQPIRRSGGPLSSRRPSGATVSSASNSHTGPFGYHYRRSLYPDQASAPLTEIRSQYIDYGQVPRTEALRAPANLRLEGTLEMEPEYRTAYCAAGQQQQQPQRDLAARRRRERSASAGRRKDSGGYWLENNNAEHFGAVNAAEQQDAFQVLHTRLHEESVVGKPPPATRRPLLGRAAPESDRSRLRNRSPSPAYPRHQHQQPSQPFSSHTDEDESSLSSSPGQVQSRNFTRHRSRRPSPSQRLPLVHASNNRSPSPIPHAPLAHCPQPAERPYSPSFGRDKPSRQQTSPTQAQPSQASSPPRSPARQAFVVLDDGPPRRRKTERRDFEPRDSLKSGAPIRHSNGGLMMSGPGNRTRNRSPSNWMPPWYDSSTSTI